MDRGFRHFAFFGFPVFEWSVRRREAFVQYVCAAGHTFYENKVTPCASWGHQQVSWQDEITVSHGGSRSCPSLWECRRDATRAESSCSTPAAWRGWPCPTRWRSSAWTTSSSLANWPSPPLSSVVPDAFRVGYEAAAMLSLLMNGGGRRSSLCYIPPLGVVTRQSTDVTAIADPRVASAMSFICAHACQGISRRRRGRASSALDATVLPTVCSGRCWTRPFHCAITDVRMGRVKRATLWPRPTSR